MKDWTPEEIRHLRHSIGLTQRKFADLLGVTEQFIYYLERGMRTPKKPFKLLLDCIEEKQLKKRKVGEKRYGKKRYL